MLNLWHPWLSTSRKWNLQNWSYMRLAYWCISLWVNPLALFSVFFSICLLVSVVSADKSFEDFLVPRCYSHISRFSCLPLAECGFSCGQNSVRPSVGAIKWFKWSQTRPSLPAPSSSKSCEYFHIIWIPEEGQDEY